MWIEARHIRATEEMHLAPVWAGAEGTQDSSTARTAIPNSRGWSSGDGDRHTVLGVEGVYIQPPSPAVNRYSIGYRASGKSFNIRSRTALTAVFPARPGPRIPVRGNWGRR